MINNASKVQERYEFTELKARILDIASQLDIDPQYKREIAVQDLVKIVDWLEGKK